MKTPFKKIRGLGLHRHDKRDRHATQRSLSQSEELSQASQDMQDMRDCYESLLSAAAGTTNSAYEFSESLQEMGDCLLEKTALSDDEDSGRVLLMLGKVQFEIQKLVDNYRSHISRTITVPSESLLNELRIVEDMKNQCDEKRMTYDIMIKQHEKRRLKTSKGEHVSSRQLQTAQDEFDENATLFIFRMKSLKRGQSHSLLTQAARHHAAQMCFFRKALKSLEAIEPHVNLTTEKQHIDYHFSGLEDDDRDSVFFTDDEDDEDDSDDYYDTLEDGLDYRKNDGKTEVSSSIELDNEDLTFQKLASVNSAKANMRGKPFWNSTTFDIDVNTVSKSVPLSARNSFDQNERFRQMRQSSIRKLNTYVLPTPLEKRPVTPRPTTNIWHSLPLEHKNYEMILKKEKVSGPLSTNNSKPTPLPGPLTEVHVDTSPAFSAKKMKRYAFSSPLTSGSQPNNGPSSPPSSASKASAFSFVSSPIISELHELPRPPANLTSNKPSKVGFLAPLGGIKSGSDLTATNKSTMPSKPTRTGEGMVSSPRSPISLKSI